MTKRKFAVGRKYTRAKIAELIDLPTDKRRGGNWQTGYDTWDGEVYVFCNVGVSGRTGPDYANEWCDKELIWYGKTGSARHQPLIARMISGQVPVHFFWRSDAKDAFLYAGEGHAIEVEDTSPMRVRWRFS